MVWMQSCRPMMDHQEYDHQSQIRLRSSSCYRRCCRRMWLRHSSLRLRKTWLRHMRFLIHRRRMLFVRHRHHRMPCVRPRHPSLVYGHQKQHRFRPSQVFGLQMLHRRHPKMGLAMNHHPRLVCVRLQHLRSS